MSLDAALQSAMETIPECFAAGYFDMATGMLLALKAEAADGEEIMETLALAVASLFQGKGIQAFGEIIRAAEADEEGGCGFGEIAVFSEDRLHVFMRTKEYPEQVVCYICRGSANVGLALTKSHMSLGAVAEAV